MSTVIVAVISSAVSFIVGGVLAYVVARWKSMLKREKALRNGVKNLLRYDIIKVHKECIEFGYCPIDIKEALVDSYGAYHDLGGNGVITKLYNEIVALPEEPHENETKEK